VSVHPSGHFAKAIKYWPIEQIKDWLKTFIKEEKDDNLKFANILDNKDLFDKFVKESSDNDKINCLLYIFNSNKFNSNEFIKIITDIYGNDINIYNAIYKILSDNPDYWKKIIDMDTELYNNSLRILLVKLICNKLKEDYQNYYINKLSGLPSTLCIYAPKHNSKFRENKLHNEVAIYLGSLINIFDTSKDKIEEIFEKRQLILCYNQYHKIISRLTTLLYPPHSKPITKKHVPRNELQKLLSTPLDDTILNPRAEPVDISSPELLAPLHCYLQNKEYKIGDEVIFDKGTVCSDGRLDLCKQVIGPIGVEDLMKSLSFDSLLEQPKVKHLLLGNNICGNELGIAIAKFINSKKSALTTWYIAGNKLDIDGITPICDALKTDNQVKQLWLKRNPIRLKGIYPIIDMLKYNNHLEVLDLTNTAIMDEGAILLLTNLNKTLKYLYLASNGLTAKTCEIIASEIHNSGLIHLSIGCNRLTDIGAKFISDALLNPECKLISLEMASAAIGPIGASYIASALKINKSLITLNIGFLKSTNDLKEIPNIFGSNGAISFADALEYNTTLRHLDLTYTGIQQAGIERIAKSLFDKNRTLVYINIEQFGIPHNELSREIIRKTVQKNRESIDKDILKEIDLIVFPQHLEEIKSVYRIK
jgi:Ran GTPase-activating protein (RanGAP) involved in mRNA processing and transport